MRHALAASLLAFAGQQVAAQVPAGFVTTSGDKFSLDGEEFIFAGSNAYYWPFNIWGDDHYADVEAGALAALDAGLRVVRTWAFHDQNATTIAGGLPQYGSGAEETVIQTFNSDGTVDIDLSILEVVVRAAENTGLKLVLALTNNWADYGGMDVYTVNHGGRYHDDFYRLPAIKEAFKNYISVVVEHFRDSPAIFAWEVANEARCGADGTRNLPRGPDCDADLLLEWYDEISTHIKSIDPNHLVTTGSEGHFDRESEDWTYNGAEGGDFDAEATLPNIDYTTFHSYPDWWGKTPEWTEQWIIDHAAAGNGKPVVHEEYGWLASNDLDRVEVVGRWQAVSLELEMSDMYWQFGYSGYSTGRNHNDGFTIYLDDAEAQPLVYEHAAAVNALNGGGEEPTPTPPPATTTSMPTPTSTSTTPPAATTTSAGPVQVRWGQCGGVSWSGPTVCQAPYTCQRQNDWYYQCL
ncbi:hypothetical protein S7711_04792 [Stachybotrys chartarum IBT 7711]|uniref:mannan endo-1,4-beta-mannosidase n=1 Tax=Stachybotrys chartarum (strain CBS 109288 / IBT 7711) TaxID=1280523 RepID=A0A084ASI2_STACB|nr:hypothetical protein S7711_04792 [Stachybotrys chartarum IBT 7711]KFA50053.1 hypothetical protein S40293_06852 [Stachybotrys chartarum IBT 40293]